MRRNFFHVMILFLGGLTTLSFASNGRIPIYGPTTITQDGSYYFTNNIVDPCAGNVITIQAKNVVLDLNGHALICTSPSSSSFAIYVDTGVSENIVIRNGSIDHPNRAIVITGSATNKGNYVIRDLKISRFAEYGIDVSNAKGNLTVENVTITSEPTGITALWVDTVDRTFIRHVKAGNVTGYVINVLHNNEVIIDGVVLNNGGSGDIQVYDSRTVTIMNSTFTDTSYGIRVIESNASTVPVTAQIFQNRVSGTTYAGIYVGANTAATHPMTVKITDNTISPSSYYGMRITGPVLVSIRKNRIYCYEGTSPTCIWTNSNYIVITDNSFFTQGGIGTAISDNGSNNYTTGNRTT